MKEKIAMEDRIRVLAYQKWEAAGCPPSDGVCYWLEAEAELSDCGDGEKCESSPPAAKKEKPVAAAASQKVAAKTSKGNR